jgi:hypothetical protein
MAVATHRKSDARASSADAKQAADELVVFGITGDLAKVMTFRSLHRADGGGPREITLDMEFEQEGGEGPTPYEVLLRAAMEGNSALFTRQDSVEETWRIMHPLIDHPPPVHRYAPRNMGTEGVRPAAQRRRRLAGPVGGRMTVTQKSDGTRIEQRSTTLRLGRRLPLVLQRDVAPRRDGFFPSVGVVNPALTAMANALRVGGHLLERMSVGSTATATATAKAAAAPARVHS